MGTLTRRQAEGALQELFWKIFKNYSKCLIVKPLLKMRICPKKCSKTLLTVQHKHRKNITSKKILLLISRKNSIRNIIQLGIASSGGILVHMWLTKPVISFTFIL